MSETNTAAGDLGWNASAGAWIKSVDGGDVNRAFLLDAVMLELCGDVRGRTVLDVGCGEGRFCRMLTERGARTIGVDPTTALIAAARVRQPQGEFHECGGEALPLAAVSVDLAVCYVALLDIPDFRGAIAEMARVLRPGGRCVVSNLNGFVTASKLFWARDDEGNKLHWTMDNYMSPRAERAEWAGISVVNWHRPLSAYMQAFLGAGLILEHYDEPVPTPEVLARHPRMSDYLRLPHFCTMAWRKPGAGGT
ncbi:MAG: class I SAM-dependent methyltransferase [Opitutales bacterium]